ncbi:MAG: SusF/SusE family outer membrane protein [Dysgonamonadaceae bacterium]
MKTIKKIASIIMMVLPFVLSSCSQDLMEGNKGETALALSANSTDVSLDVLNPSENAVTFNWTSGTNGGTNAGITYKFELAIAGTNFSEPLVIELGKGSASLVYTNEQLNSLLIDSLKISPETEANLEARVIASVLPSQGQQTSNVVSLKAKTYTPLASALYLIGSAAPNGWSADNATKMNSVAGTVGGFVWQGKLNAGELKFITTLGHFTPSYNKGADATTLYLRQSDQDAYDEKFVIPTTGTYKVTMNILSLTISIEALEAPLYSDLWFTGGFNGWSFTAMRNDLLDPFVFHYNAVLNSINSSDEFKIATQARFDNDVIFLRPAVNQQGVGTDLAVSQWAENTNPNDYKWKISNGTYKIKLDTREMKIDIVPFTPYAMIYLVGDATPSGWNIGGATPMTAVAGNPYKFTWTGTLNAGELKFTCDKQSDWNGAWFLASSGDIAPSGSEEQMVFSAQGANPDNKWKISAAGTYTIELDQLQELVKIVKQ